MGRNVFTHRRSVQGRWTENMWANYPAHEMEERDPLPEYIYDLEPFMEMKPERRTPKENPVTDQLRVKAEKLNFDNLIKSKPEYLDPNYVQKYKKSE